MIIGSQPSSLSATPVFNSADDPSRADPLFVEAYSGGGTFERVRWLGPALQVSQPINALPTASIDVITHTGWLVNTGSATNPVLKTIEEALPDDRLIQVRTARGEPSANDVIFRGYREKIGLRGSPAGRTARLHFVHEAQRIAETLKYVVTGQLVRSRQEIEDQAEAFWHLESEPAVFNPDGKPNCEDHLVELADDAGGGAPLEVPIFCNIYSANGTRIRPQRWTWARVFAYLLFWLRRRPDAEGPFFGVGEWPQWGDGAAIIDRNLLDAIRSVAALDIDPDLLGDSPSPDPLTRALLGVPRSHSIEGLDWIDALKWTCARSGIGFTVDTFFDGDLRAFRSGFRFFTPGWTPQHSEDVPVLNRQGALKLASPNYTTADKVWGTQVLAANDVTNCSLEFDGSRCINELQVVGGPREYEVTVELVPGWKYVQSRSPQVDFDPADAAGIAAAVVALQSAEYVEAYTTGPLASLRNAGDNRDVGRAWIGCDAADMRDSDLPRLFAPWTQSRYHALSLATLQVEDAQRSDGAFSDAKIVCKPRPVRTCLTGGGPDSGRPPAVELSIAGGAWFEVPDARVSSRTLRVYLDTQDLRTLGGTGSPYSFAEALIRGTARVRVTGTIEGDRLAALFPLASTASLSGRARGKHLSDPRGLRFRLRDDQDGYAGGNSRFRGQSATPAEQRLPDHDMYTYAAMLERVDRVRCVGAIETVGLRFPREGTAAPNLRPGDELTAIVAEAGQRDHDLPLRSRMDDVHAIVAAVLWVYDPGNGKDRATRISTEYTLEDPSEMIRFPGMRGGNRR